MADEMGLSQVGVMSLTRFTRKARASSMSTRIMAKRDQASTTRALSHIEARVQTVRKANQANAVTAIAARNLVRFSPNFRWIDMFKDIIFPHDISEGSDAATLFSTQVNEVASGHDQRMSLWDYPKMEFNVAYGVRTMEQLHDLIRFFRAVRGKLYSFRYLDKLDCTSSFATYEEARAADDITPFDQEIGIGDNVNNTFQLRKNYDFETEQSQRPIIKPIEDTVSVAVAGEEITWFLCDYSTGKISIHSRIDEDWTGVTLATVGDVAQKRWRLTVPGYVADNPATNVNERVNQPVPTMHIGERFKFVTAGVSVYNATVASSEAGAFEFYWPDGVPANAGAALAGRFTTNNIPKVGDRVTAGYEFHVPVRFDTDRIPVKLEYYGVGSAQEITLVEVRPDEE
jgi:uncharacterized protein (TIGR02217 family)